MNRRDFLTVIGGAGVASLAAIRPTYAGTERTTDLFLDGLVMISFEDPILRIGFPKAPGHKATLQIVPVTGASRTINIKGNGSLETKAAGGSKPAIKVPELVRMSEFFGNDVKARFNQCANIIEIPYSAIKSISTSKVTKDRWTFVRTDSGQELDTFRPRQVAEALRIELLSDSVLKLDGGKTAISLATTQELRSEYAPEAKNRRADMIEDHFVHYFQNIERPPAADFMVAPKKLTGAMGPSPRKIGNQFMMIDGTPICWLVCIGLING
jgi:hypothetical protein